MKKTAAVLLVISLLVNIVPAFAFEKSSFDDKMTELAGLRQQCTQAGISTVYEDINYYTLKKCLPYIDEDTDYYSDEIMAYNEAALEALYTEAKENMEAYLNGTKEPAKAPYIYKTGDFNVNGKSLVTDEGRPFFSIGVGHGAKARDDVSELARYGYSNIQAEIGLDDVITECLDDSADYVIDETEIENMCSVLARAESSDIGVTVLLSTHYFPEFLFEKYPDLQADAGNQGYNPHHPVAREIIEKFLHLTMSRFSHYSSLFSVCLANEPSKPCSDSEFYKPYFQNYLKEKHGTIETINSIYGSEYTDFSDIEIPTEVSGAIAYDWMQCQDGLYAEHLVFMKNIIAEYTSVPTSTKLLREIARYVTSSSNEYKDNIFRGISPEKIKAASGLAGTDEEHYYKNVDGTGFFGTLQWYDTLSSIYEMPVYNSEDHIVSKTDKRYDDYQRKHTSSVLWQSAIHGLGMSTIWVWERSYTEGSQFANSILCRPDVLAGTGKVNYELNRLANEVTAFVRQKPSVAIWRSDATVIHETTQTDGNAHHAVCDKYYLGSIYAGEKPGFVSDEYYDNLNDYKLLIIPQVTHITKGGLLKIKEFIENGGKVIMYSADSNSLCYDEYGRVHDSVTVDYIKNNSTVTSIYPNETNDIIGGSEAAQYLAGQFASSLNKNISLVDENGNTITGVDWQSADYRGTTLINMCSMRRQTNPKVYIKIDGKTVESAVDLISGQTYSAGFTLYEKQPILLQVGTPTGDIPTFEPLKTETSVGAAYSKDSKAKDVTDVDYNAKTRKFTWNIADGDYNGASIYGITAEGGKKRLGKVWGNEFTYAPAEYEPMLVLICAFDRDGNETAGKMYKMNMSDEEFTVSKSELDAQNGVGVIEIQNNSSGDIYRNIIAAIYSADNKLIYASGLNAFLKPGQAEEFKILFPLRTDECYIKIIQE